MGTRGAIGVRINDGTSDRTVTQYVTGLKFTKQADGGMRDAACNVNLPLGTFSDLGPADRIYYTDARHGGPVWDGYLDAPTPTRGPGGQAFEISAYGGMTRAGDETRPLIYIDTDLAGWTQYQGPTSARSANAATATDPTLGDAVAGANQGLLCQFNPGAPVGTGQVAQMSYTRLADAGMRLAQIVTYFRSGKNATNGDYTADIVWSANGSNSSGISTTRTYRSADAAASFPGTTTSIALRLRRAGGATNVADDATWAFFDEVAVIGRRMDRFGVDSAVGSGNPKIVTTDQVIEDLLGRLLTFCDPAASSVAAGTRQIDQIAYPDGTTAQAVLDDLGDYEPDMLWEILQSTSSGPMGRHVFNYRPWPTIPRYEVSSRDGYTEPGADVDLANRIAVTWTDIDGTPRVTVVTATAEQYPAVRALELAGRTRDAEPVALAEGRGSLANAQALGAAILADKNNLGTSARATIRRPITDLYTGRMVMPWEIEPGHLVRVRETGADLRLTEMEYDDDEVSTVVTLGYPSKTREERIAAFSRVPA